MTDWFKIITDLERAGISNTELGRRCRPRKKPEQGRDRNTIHKWKMGYSEPPYSEGQQILAIHASFVSKIPQSVQ